MAFQGIDIRQTGDRLVFRVSLKDSTGAILTSGTTNLRLYELQNDGTLKSYDWSSNTFKTTTLTTEHQALTHRTGNNTARNTGLWTYALTTLTGFTAGNIYLAQVSNTGASPPEQEREFQFGVSSAFNPFDSVRGGLTALPNANADAAGGLPISDAGGLDLDALYSNVGNCVLKIQQAIDFIEFQRGQHTVVGSVYYVDGNDGNDTTGAGTRLLPWATLSKAITAAGTNHDLILVMPGTVTESSTITVAKSYLQIRGVGRDCNITLSGAGSVFSITASGVQLAGLRITTNSGGSSDGISISSGTDFVDIYRCWIENPHRDGVNISVATNCFVRECHIIGAGRTGIRVASGAGSGTRNKVLGNLIRNCVTSGINFEGADASYSRCQGNTIMDTPIGIDISSGVLSSMVSDNRYGGCTTNLQDNGTGTSHSWNVLTTNITTGAVLTDGLAYLTNGTYGLSALNADLDTLLTRIVGTLLAGNHTAQSGDTFARLGAPSGASVSDDISALNADVDTAQVDIDTLLTRLSASRAGYLDNLNVSGVVASQADINALNQSASRRLTLVTVGQYERPEASSTPFQLELRTYDGDGVPTNADSTPTITATGITSGSLDANLSAVSNPSTGVYRCTYTVTNSATLEQIRFDASATISLTAFTIATYSQVVDFVAATWTSADQTKLTAIYNKLPTVNYLLGSGNSDGSGYLTPTVAGRSLKVSATGYPGLDWSDIVNQNAVVSFTTTTVSSVTTVGFCSFAETIRQIVDESLNEYNAYDLISGIGTNVSSVKAKTDNLPSSPAAVGSPMTLANNAITSNAIADGAITEAKITTPAETPGAPTGIFGMIRRVFELIPGVRKQNRNRATGVVTVRNAADDGDLVTYTQSTVGDVDTLSEGS